MKFVISSTTFCNRLQILNKVIGSKNPLPILDCILFNLEGDNLSMTASDGDITLVSNLAVTDAEGAGKFAINSAQIINVLKEISDQPVKISINEGTFEIEIKYQNGTCNFIGLNGETYPIPAGIGESAQSITIDSGILLQGINKSVFATAEDELRPVMNGIYFDFSTDSVTFVASDGHKLVRDRYYASNSEQASAFILPKKPSKTLKDILAHEEGDALIKFDNNNAVVSVENYELSCRLIEGRYPNYNSVIPSDNPYKVRIDRQAFIGALRRVQVFANTSTNLIKLRINKNNITVSAQDVDFAKKAEENIICEYDGNPMNIGFKGNFLIDILNSISAQEVMLELADPSRAGVIVPAEQEEKEDLLMLLMPMMLND